MKINHEETKETKKEQKIPMRVRIFVVDFPQESFMSSLKTP